MPSNKSSNKTNNDIDEISNQYEKVSQLEHILLRPDMYVGSVECVTENKYVINTDNDYENSNKTMVLKDITYSPGLYKIYDEILANARDQKVRDANVKEIRINIDKEKGLISIYNDGEGIPTIVHKEYNIRVPELIFGNLLTSSNYKSNEERITGGKNGYGAKLTNIYSTYFKVETLYSKTNELYSQEFEKNMSVKNEPVITKKKKGEKTFTRISFIPDFPKFNVEKITDDIYEVFKKRCFDLNASLPNDVSVYFNDELIEENTLEKYASLFLPNAEKKDLIYEKVNNYWEVLVSLAPSDDHFQQFSFVNGINTEKGGKHVDHVVNQITKKIAEFIKTKKKKNVKQNYIKDNLWVFINSTIVNPSFDSQTKEFLTTRADKFGSVCELSEKFIEKLTKTDLIERVINLTEFKENKELKKTDGKKSGVIRIPKLEDANLAGTSHGKDCTLILTEGDSAKTFAISGLSIIGRDYYGVFPLRGKFINVRDKSPNDINKNEEVKNLKQILGLQTGKVYTNLDSLRYGSIMILTDADDDGSHIKGLVMNFFEYFWPSLIKIPGFIVSFLTPIIKVSKGNNHISFYTNTDYEEWKAANNEGKGWSIKYYKGLGTSTSKEAKEYFKIMNDSIIKYVIDDENSDTKSIILAFGSSQKKDENGMKYSDKRKDWLGGYDRKNILNVKKGNVPYKDFINKELIHFSNADNIRSIPNLIDGFKPSQRKIMYCCFKRNLTKEIKVAQLSGYVSENSAYHHGEVSLQGTIIGLAQNFCGSNNINLLMPNGQFGTRITGGKDHASCRYIFTELNPITKFIFNENDIPLLNYKYDDGLKVEPDFYVPIIPTILVNGSEGIGTGYSTKVPTYNPVDIINNLKRMIKGDDIKPMMPWYKGYTGSIIKIGDDNNRFMSRGVYNFLDFNTLEVTELPIGKWIDEYKEDILTKWLYDEKTNKDGFLTNYENHSTESTVKFILKFRPGLLTQMRANIVKLEKTLKLNAPISTTNMHLYDENEEIKKFNEVDDVLKYFFNIRLFYYNKRRDYLLRKLKRELDIIMYKVKFIEDIIEEKIVIFKKKKDEVTQILIDNDYPVFNLQGDIMNPECDADGNYNYLTSMPIYTFTQERIDELKKQRENKNAELKELESKSEKDLWVNDLDVLLNKYNDFYENYLEQVKNEKLDKKSNKTKSKFKGKPKVKKVKK